MLLNWESNVGLATFMVVVPSESVTTRTPFVTAMVTDVASGVNPFARFVCPAYWPAHAVGSAFTDGDDHGTVEELWTRVPAKLRTVFALNAKLMSNWLVTLSSALTN